MKNKGKIGLELRVRTDKGTYIHLIEHRNNLGADVF
jgi:hypothetical protein